MPPKNKYATLSLAALALLGLGTFIGTKLASPPSTPTAAGKPAATPEEIAKILNIPKPQAPASRSAADSSPASKKINALAQLNQPNSDPQNDIRIIEHLLQEAHSAFHALPTGDHDEVVSFLRGQNSLNIAYFPEDDPNLNADGEIIDRWGTPYFFHTLSRDRIEVRSAGPDKLHWSEDDLVSESQTIKQSAFVASLSPQDPIPSEPPAP